MKILKLLNRATLILIDIVLVMLSYLGALFFRFDTQIPVVYRKIFLENLPYILIIYILTFYLFRLYKSLWLMASIDEFMMAVGACIIGNWASLGAQYALGRTLPLIVNILA
ncbi:MAG TPA: polysaccharide biosynthesis protein, partial [Clostridiaceae bacterium]